jgi:hypothetical protein
MMKPPAAFDPIRAFGTLTKHGVRFVVIGGFAGKIWGSPTVTNDVDICYSRDRPNLERLASALSSLNARLRGVAEEVPFQLDARTIEAGDHFTFATDAGNLDCLGIPSGSNGYDDLARSAVEFDLGGLTVSVSALEDLIRMKRASARPKDLIEVEVLKALQEETERS